MSRTLRRARLLPRLRWAALNGAPLPHVEASTSQDVLPGLGASRTPQNTRSQLFSTLLRTLSIGCDVQTFAPERGLATKATRGRRRASAAEPPVDDGDEEAKYRRRQEMLRDVIAKINEDLGPGSVMLPGAEGHFPGVETFSSGVLPLDVALGGGWPRGRIVEVYGHESSGKTSLALHAIAEIQKQRQTAVLIDAEHALNMEYARKLGVITHGPDAMLMVQPSSGEHAIDVADSLLRSGIASLIVIDSVSALVPQAELDAAAGLGALGSLARLMSMALRRLSIHASKSNGTVMFLNQIRNKIGVYGNPETTSGGLALKFHASVRCEVKAVERKKIVGEDVGYRCRVRIVKSKVSMPYRSAEFDVLHGQGVQQHAALLDAAERIGVVSRRGSHYYVAGENIHGKEKAVTYLKENAAAYNELDMAVRNLIKEGRDLEAGADENMEEEVEEELAIEDETPWDRVEAAASSP